MGIETAILIGMAASAAVSAVGAIQQGQAQKASYDSQAQANEYNAKVQENNAIYARNNADSANQQASAKEELQRRRFAAVQGQANAGVAQSGTGFGGSNADVLKQNAINAELDALNIRYEGDLQSKGLMQTASNNEAQAGLDRFQASAARQNGDNAVTGSYLSAGSNLLAGATKYGYYSQTGKL